MQSRYIQNVAECEHCESGLKGLLGIVFLIETK